MAISAQKKPPGLPNAGFPPLSNHSSYATSGSFTSRFQLKKLIIVFLIAIGLIPGLLGLTGIYRTSKNELLQSRALYFTEVASFTAFQVEKILGERLEGVNRLARLPTIKNLLLFPQESGVKEIENIRKILMPELAKAYFLANIYNRAGEIVFSSDIGNKAFSRSFNFYGIDLDVVNTGKVYISKMFENSGEKGQYYIEIYAPILDDNGAGIGFIEARHTMNQLFDTIKSVKIGETGNASLLASSGNILICPSYPSMSHLVNSKLLERITRGDTGWIIADDDAHGSTGAIVGFAPVNMKKDDLAKGSFENQSWYIFTRQDASETFGAIHEFQKAAVMYAIMLVLVAVGLGGFAWRQIMKAQKAHETELVYKEKADSIKHLVTSFRRLMIKPLAEIPALVSNIDKASEGESLRQGHVDKLKQHLANFDSLAKHLEYYTQLDAFEPKPTDLIGVAEDSLLLLDYIITSKDVEIRFEKPPEPILVMGQPKLLSVVFMNIVLNAIHAVDYKGLILIKIEKKRDTGILTVRDNGKGIPKAEMENIFDPFYTTKKGHEGYGLGLAVSRGIVERHEGEIVVKSSEGSGTDVIVKLKLSHKELLDVEEVTEIAYK